MVNGSKIAILGNSVSMLVIPQRVGAHEKTYIEHLGEAGFSVINASKQSVMLSDTYRYLEDEIIRHYPDYVVINMGIVEATYRARPRFLQNYFNENAWKNSIINIDYCSVTQRAARRVIKFIYRHLERAMYALHLKWRWMPPGKYRHALRDILIAILRDTGTKKVFILGMLPIAPSLERKIPGTNNSIIQYNKIMQDISGLFKTVSYVDLEAILYAKESFAVSNDSIHFNAQGHRMIAEKLAALIKESEGCG